jgi:hypothetical protein
MGGDFTLRIASERRESNLIGNEPKKPGLEVTEMNWTCAITVRGLKMHAKKMV